MFCSESIFHVYIYIYAFVYVNMYFIQEDVS